MDLEGSMGSNKNGMPEESVDELIRKLNDRGTKVKIISENDEAADKENTKNLRKSMDGQHNQRPPLAQK